MVIIPLDYIPSTLPDFALPDIVSTNPGARAYSLSNREGTDAASKRRKLHGKQGRKFLTQDLYPEEMYPQGW